VSGNGTISSFDAALVLQYSVGIRHHFPVGYRPGSDTVDWAFRPSSRSYTPLQSSQSDQNYVSILYGDVSGNWSGDFLVTQLVDKKPTALFSINVAKDENTEVLKSLTSTHRETSLTAIQDKSKMKNNDFAQPLENSIDPKQGISSMNAKILSHQIVFPVEIKDTKNLLSTDLQICYNPEHLRPINMKTSETTKDFMIAGADYGGLLRIAIAGTQKLNGNLKLLDVSFEVKGEEDLASPEIKVDWLIVNEGDDKPITDGVMAETEPYQLFLLKSQPNPFVNEISLHYSLLKESKVMINVYNSCGQVVKTLVDEVKKSGDYYISWNGRDDKEKTQPNGIYFIRMDVGSRKFEKKVILVK
jgi:hypothetical protein